MSSDAGEVRARRVARWIAPVVVVVVVALDQLTKAWAVRNLTENLPQAVVGSVLEWRLSYNSGAAFSLFQGFTPLLAVLAVVIAAFLVRAVRRADDALLVVALSLVLGGALGNLVDRVGRADGFLDGKVVDFIHITHWPTFNVADSAITVGALALIWWGWRRPDEKAPPAEPPAGA